MERLVLLGFFPLLALFQIVAKEREVSEWKEKYEESRREVMEMRWVIACHRSHQQSHSACG